MSQQMSKPLLLSLLLGIFMGALDLTILAPAIPHLSSSFGVTPAGVVLAFSIYAAFYAVSVPLMSKLADVRGYKLIYGVSMGTFAFGSALAALAPTLPILIIARCIQGIGGGGLFPVAQAIVGAVLPEHRRGHVLGLLMAAFALGGVLGPNLGGFLVQHLSWQWIFWINVPLGVIGMALVARAELPGRRKDVRIDWIGAALVAVTFGSLVLGVESLRSLREVDFFSPRVGAFFLLTVIGLALLIPIERSKKEPMLDFRLITSRAIAPLLGVSALVGYALLSGVIFVPLYVQLRFAATSFGSGAVLNAAAAGLALSSWIAGAYTHRTGGRPLVILGMASTAAGIALMILLQESLPGILAGLALVGAGLGLAQGPVSYMGLALAPPKDHGQISGLISITRSMGGAIGITASGVVLSEATHRLRRYIPEHETLNKEDWTSLTGIEALREAPQEVQALVIDTLTAGVIEVWYWAAGAAVAGMLVAWALRRKERRPAAGGAV